MSIAINNTLGLMAILPEWAPNLHPLVVHFPIALLVIAVLVDFIRLAKRKHEGLNLTVQILYGLGTLGLIFAFLSGREATETVEVAGQAFSVLASHENWALATMIFFYRFFWTSICRLLVSARYA